MEVEEGEEEKAVTPSYMDDTDPEPASQEPRQTDPQTGPQNSSLSETQRNPTEERAVNDRRATSGDSTSHSSAMRSQEESVALHNPTAQNLSTSSQGGGVGIITEEAMLARVSVLQAQEHTLLTNIQAENARRMRAQRETDDQISFTHQKLTRLEADLAAREHAFSDLERNIRLAKEQGSRLRANNDDLVDADGDSPEYLGLNQAEQSKPTSASSDAVKPTSGVGATARTSTAAAPSTPRATQKLMDAICHTNPAWSGMGRENENSSARRDSNWTSAGQTDPTSTGTNQSRDGAFAPDGIFQAPQDPPTKTKSSDPWGRKISETAGTSTAPPDSGAARGFNNVYSTVSVPSRVTSVEDITGTWINSARNWLTSHGHSSADALENLFDRQLWTTLRIALRTEMADTSERFLSALHHRYHNPQQGIRQLPVVSVERIFEDAPTTDKIIHAILTAHRDETALNAGTDPDPGFTLRYEKSILDLQNLKKIQRWADLHEAVTEKTGRPQRSIGDFVQRMADYVARVRDVELLSRSFDAPITTSVNMQPRETGTKTYVAATDPPPQGMVCAACGHVKHGPKHCRFVQDKHPGVNKAHAHTSWAESTQGRAYASLPGAFKRLAPHLTPQGEPIAPPPQRQQQNNKYGGNTSCSYHYQYSPSNDDVFLPFLVKSQEEAAREKRVLVDSGASHASYITRTCADELGLTVSPSTFVSCSVDRCTCSTGVVSLSVKIHGSYQSLSFQLYDPGADVTAPDLVIGLPDIRKYCVVIDRWEHFFTKDNCPSRPRLLVATPVTPRKKVHFDLEEHIGRMPPKANTLPKRLPFGGWFASITGGTPKDLEDKAQVELDQVKLILDSLDQTQWDPPDPWEQTPMAWELFTQPAGHRADMDKIKYEGSQHSQSLLRKVTQEFQDVFSETLHGPPSKVKPMRLELDEALWHLPKNRSAVRQLSPPKLEVERVEVRKLQEAGILQPSEANYWSHPHIPQKPKQDPSKPTQYRFCLDLRALNEACVSIGWPLPRIQDLMQRIARANAKYFCVLDLTSGYFQVALDQASRKYTAIRTHYGNFESTRIPMGAKGAASYFQKQMSEEVLRGYLYDFLELYIDDIIIYADTEETLAGNLSKVLRRLREWNITVHPGKAKLGMTSVEYVGHVISSTGLSMSREKIQRIQNFPRPTTKKDIQSFLGMVGWFKDHIPNFSQVSRGLRALVQHGDAPSFQREWTSETFESFENLKNMVNLCPHLYFINDDDEVHLETDASQSGIGAILYVIREGKKYPIQWFSATFNKQQQNWRTQEQECYGIIAAVKEFHHYLSHIHFTLHTDHKSLLALNDGNGKVVRWKVELSNYNFTLVHIPGKENVVADALSRLEEIRKTGGYFFALRRARQPTVLGKDKGVDTAKQELNIPEEVTNLLHKCHGRCSGHLGVVKTVERIYTHDDKKVLTKFPAKDIKTWTSIFIRRCMACQAMSMLTPKIKTFPFLLGGSAPFVRINFDSIGPLDKDIYGYTHVLVIIDTFSRYARLRPLKDLTGVTAAFHLKEYVNTYGVPAVMLSDNGSQFVNEVLTSFATLAGSAKLETLAYSHEENGIVERANREVLRHLRTLIYETSLKKHWSEMLPDVERIMNSTPHAATGTSPANIVFGESVNLSRGIMAPLDEGSLPAREDYRDFIIRQKVFQGEAIRLAQAKLLQQQRKIALYGDKHDTSITSYTPGAYVMLKVDNDKRNRAGDKLSPRWTGPFRVISASHNGHRYEIEDIPTGKLEKVHVTELKLFHHDPNSDPDLIAIAKADHYLVESIIDHRISVYPTDNPRKKGSPQHKKVYEFLVHWENYPESARTWEPIINLRANAVFHDYCTKNNLTSLIPKRFQ
jgi:hypothetical protein